MFKKRIKKISFVFTKIQRSYWFLLIIIIIWTIITVVNVIIIAVVIIIIVNVKEMYTSHGLICSTVENLAVFFHSYLSSLSLSSSPVPSRFFSCLSLLFNLESMCHCWYIAYYFFIGERYKARENKKESKNNLWDQTGVFLLFFLDVFTV